MSAFGGKADIGRTRHVRPCPFHFWSYVKICRQHHFPKGTGKVGGDQAITVDLCPQANWTIQNFGVFRAEEVRTIADKMKAGEPRAIMLRIAASYERIAKIVEQGTLDPK
jgi:hypothetical protein